MRRNNRLSLLLWPALAGVLVIGALLVAPLPAPFGGDGAATPTVPPPTAAPARTPRPTQTPAPTLTPSPTPVPVPVSVTTEPPSSLAIERATFGLVEIDVIVGAGT